jgi:hypothetical protein
MVYVMKFFWHYLLANHFIFFCGSLSLNLHGPQTNHFRDRLPSGCNFWWSLIEVVYKPRKECIVAYFFSQMDNIRATLEGCNHNEMSQHDYFAKRLWPFFSPHDLHIKEFLNEIFCNLLLKIFIVFLTHHIFYVNYFQIIMILLKV